MNVIKKWFPRVFWTIVLIIFIGWIHSVNPNLLPTLGSWLGKSFMSGLDGLTKFIGNLFHS